MAASTPASAGGIFVSYRHDDAAYPAGWLVDRLAGRFGASRVFKDVDSIQLGDDFVEDIMAAVGSCAVLLAVIGVWWLTATGEDGRRRLDDPGDFVRLEIEAALTRDVLVIPVLVDGARMPRAADLPASLEGLARRQALELNPGSFDTSRLLRMLDSALAGTSPADPADATSVRTAGQTGTSDRGSGGDEGRPARRPHRRLIVSQPRTGEARTGGTGPSRPGPARRPPSGSLLFEPDPKTSPSARRRTLGRGRRSRRMTLIGVPAVVVVAVAALMSGLLMGHVINFGQLTANRLAPQGTTTATLAGYPGQQPRGVFQTLNRVVASGGTIVALGSQVSDGLVRQQFFVSSDGGKTWRLARLNVAGGGKGGQVPLGHQATLLAGGPGGWLAIGPQAIWASPDGTSWMLASTHGVTPQLPGDSVLVITKTATGFLAAGKGDAAGGRTQAVIWTSRDGLTWQRMTAADLGLAGAGEAVRSISYATYRGDDTLIAGAVAAAGGAYSGAWLSTDGGSAWTRVHIPVSNGAGDTISGLAWDDAGLIAIRPGGGTSPSTAFGVAYFSPNGLAWRYAGTINAAAGWSPHVVKGSDDGFVVDGQTATGRYVAYTSTGTGVTWQPTGSLGQVTGESITGVTVAPDGTVIAVGATHASAVSQRPVFLKATTTGGVRPVSVPGETVPELTVNSTAISPAGTMVAVGSADGYPAVWQRPPGGTWRLVSSLSLVSAYPGLTALTSVTYYGSSGWLAVGVPGPVVLGSADGTTWQRTRGSIEEHLGQVSAVAVAAGPAGYSVVGRPVGPDSASMADVCWSPDLTSWTKGQDMNVMSGPIQVLAVAAEPHGFVSAGSHNNNPAVWTTSDGKLWTTIDLALPAGASSAVLQQIAISGSHVVALGLQIQAGSPCCSPNNPPTSARAGGRCRSARLARTQ